MNLYILVEGRQTERKVYPQWLKHLIPALEQKKLVEDVVHNHYYLFSSEGFPCILDDIAICIEEINETSKFDYFVVVVDADEDCVDDRCKEIQECIDNQIITLTDDTQSIIIIQNRTFETWFLGNEKIFKSNPQDTRLVTYQKHYNVSINDPEAMPVLPHDKRTHAQFHSDYCKLFLKERNINYSKKNPHGVVEKHYLNSLIQRNQNTGHLQSLQKFIEFCHVVNEEIQSQ